MMIVVFIQAPWLLVLLHRVLIDFTIQRHAFIFYTIKELPPDHMSVAGSRTSLRDCHARCVHCSSYWNFFKPFLTLAVFACGPRSSTLVLQTGLPRMAWQVMGDVGTYEGCNYNTQSDDTTSSASRKWHHCSSQNFVETTEFWVSARVSPQHNDITSGLYWVESSCQGWWLCPPHFAGLFPVTTSWAVMGSDSGVGEISHHKWEPDKPTFKCVKFELPEYPKL